MTGTSQYAPEATYRLSPIQESILFEHLAQPGSGVYTEQLNCTLVGQLDGDAFREAWRRVVERHAVLRTSFDWRNRNRPVQVVWREASLDWKEVSSDGGQSRLRELLCDDRSRG